FSFRKIEDFADFIDRGGTLFHQNLDRGVGDDRLTVIGSEEILDVLGNGGEAEVVFAGPLGHRVHEGGRVGVAHQVPSLIDNEETFLLIGFNLGPDVIENNKHRD